MEKEKRGGVRERSGRSRIEKDVQKRRNVSLSDKWIEKAELIGGNVSKGIRIALEHYNFPKNQTGNKK